MRAVLVILLFATTGIVQAGEPVDVPSGQAATLEEWLVDPAGTNGLTWRFRLVAPDIARDAGTIDLDTALTDIDAICAELVVKRLTESAEPPAQVVITLMDRFVPFGSAAPEATQYIEAFRIEDGTCVWEGF